MPNWLDRAGVPLFISRRRLYQRKTLPRATGPWALDSGGFTELKRGGWSLGAVGYAAEVRRYRDQIGQMAWASPQDWMCEPSMLALTGLTIADHQARTVRNYLDLRQAAADLPFIPVLQGWEPDDYRRHADLYATEGIDLDREPVVGLGSVCRRQHLPEIEGVVRSLAPLRLHAFGFKITGLGRVGDALVSADSMAWSLDARRNPPLPGCSHRSCANCLKWALAWRCRMLARIEGRPRQFRLF